MVRELLLLSPVYDERFAKWLEREVVRRYNRGACDSCVKMSLADIRVEPHDSGYLVEIDPPYEVMEDWIEGIVSEIAKQLGFGIKRVD